MIASEQADFEVHQRLLRIENNQTGLDERATCPNLLNMTHRDVLGVDCGDYETLGLYP